MPVPNARGNQMIPRTRCALEIAFCSRPRQVGDEMRHKSLLPQGLLDAHEVKVT